MKITFLGVGEACDENVPNTSILIQDRLNILLDCGYSVPPFVWKRFPDCNFINVIYFSHLHADHYFGLPSLLVRMYEEKRTKPLIIICQQADRKTINQISDLGYRTVLKRIKFEIKYLSASAGKRIIFDEYQFTFAPTFHPLPNLAIKIKTANKTVCYSGDGLFTPESVRLFTDCDLLIHEGYLYDQPHPTHGTMTKVFNMAIKNKIKSLAFVHIQRNIRKAKLQKLRKHFMSKKTKTFFPETGQQIILEPV